ncbi:hypothetical protein [Dyadobacter bucti]|uniref:hypothetical protein n=1 Tax=Dyadobacter bucti TaxID=2572203 RepID=UPI003F72321F
MPTLTENTTVAIFGSKTLGVLSMIFILFSCGDSNIETQNPSDYFPLQVGRFVIYDVKVETYSAGKDTPTLSSWQEKDQVIDEELSDSDFQQFTIGRFRRDGNADFWQKTTEYRVRKFREKILTIMDGQTFFSILYPINSASEWNGNTYNNLDKELYRYSDIGVPQTIAGQSFNQTMLVIERQDSSAINKYVGIKQYALGVGLILDDQISLEYCQSEECLANDLKKIESGSHITRTVKQYGVAN